MDAIAKTLKMLGHPDRLRILAVLRRGELTVSELTQVLDLSQPRVTQYVGSLEEAGLIERLREGSWVFARIRMVDGGVSEIVSTVLRALPQDDPMLVADSARLDDVRRARAVLAEDFFADVANNRGQLSHDFLPSEPTEQCLLKRAGSGPFDHMVDLGTGSGRMLQLFAGHVKRGTGIDLSPDMLRVARHTLAGERYAHLFVQLGDITATALRDGSADLVTLHHVLHYLDDPSTVLSEARRLLRPGGSLLIADFAAHEHEAFRERYAHRRLGFPEGELATILSGQGFELMSVETISTPESASSDTDAPNVLVWHARRTAEQQRNAA